LAVRINSGRVSGCKSAGCPNCSGVCTFASKIAKRQVGFINELRKDEATKIIVALEKLIKFNIK
ncbi:hypothetical protein L5F35_03765, partial [Aliarcobacter butzleri]|uniref:hypothetical protein n=1 Tax=Aliarcobacter butzleri TaxID=28197 RepID=UPI001EDAE2A0